MPDLSRLDGKIALVTGAAQGIGEAVARLFVERGVAGLMLTDRQAEKGNVVAAELGRIVPTRFIAADLSDAADVSRVVPAAEEAFGRVDVLVNVAGLTDRGGILDTDVALWDRIFAINTRAPFLLMQAALKLMLREGKGGAIVNIISINTYGGTPFLTPYSASKAALANLTKNVAHSMSNNRIRVNGLNVGWVASPGEDEVLKRFHNAGDNWLAEAEQGMPFGRLLKPDDVARAVGFLASDESGLMTGSLIDFDQVVMGANGAAGEKLPALG